MRLERQFLTSGKHFVARVYDLRIVHWMKWPSVWRRGRRVEVLRCDDARLGWRPAPNPHSQPFSHLSVSTFNVCFDTYFAGQRYQAIADLLAADPPDVMVFQEVTDAALDILLAQPWVRKHYLSASVVGRRVGTYGMLLLSRVPVADVVYTRLPTRAHRGYLRADLLVDGARTAICSVHLDSGKSSASLRARQLSRIFAALNDDADAIVLGDFNMRDAESHLIAEPFRDVWPTVRPDDGYTEDTSTNAMLFRKTNKPRAVRFDRVLLKGSAWQAETIELIGTDPISTDVPRVFPSDHFGVRCVLRFG